MIWKKKYRELTFLTKIYSEKKENNILKQKNQIYEIWFEHIINRYIKLKIFE